MPLVLSLNFHVNMLAYCGDLEAASVVAKQEAAREATGIRIVSYGARLVVVHQGHRAEMSPPLAAIQDELMSNSDGYALQVATLATASATTASVDTTRRSRPVMSIQLTFLGAVLRLRVGRSRGESRKNGPRARCAR